jgi:hypothetical protein
MLGLFLVAWAVAPALILSTSFGLGLLVRRLSGGRPGDVFVLPVGFAAALVLGSLFTQWGATAELTPFVLVIGALAGLLIERRYLMDCLRPSRDVVWGAAAAFIGFAVIAAPVVLTGEPGFTGYGRIVDLGHHLDFTAYLASHGRETPSAPASSFLDVSRKLLAAGYPGAWQSDLAAFSRLLGTDPVWIYQPLLAVTSAIGALAFYGLLGRAVQPLPLRALSAGVAIQPNVLYSYGLTSGFKELAAASLLVLAAGLAAELPPVFARWRAGLPLGVALAASVADFSFGIVPWLGVIIAGFLVLALVQSRLRPRVVLAWASVGLVALVLSVPTIVEGAKLAPIAAKAEGGSSAARTVLVDLGNLAAAMPVRAATGIWPNEDYRYPRMVKEGLTGTMMVFVIALGGAGLVAALRRRDWGIIFLAAGGGIGLAYFMARTGPWIQLKAIAITGAAVLACAFAGATAVGGWIGRLFEADRSVSLVASSLLAAVVAGAVLYGNALAYHNAALAPAKRLRDVDRIGTRYAGRGPALYTDFEEVAEYLLRREDAVGIVDPPGGRIPLKRPGARRREDEQGFALDTDQLTLPYLNSFSLIIRRTGPERSRLPSNWELTERTPYHEIWRKAKPAATVSLHEPYEGPRLSCRRFAAKARALARSAPARVAYVQAPDATRFRLGVLEHPPNWSPKTPSSLVLAGRGSVAGNVALRRSGTYVVWIAGDFGRVVRVSVDGKQVAAIRRIHSYADQYLELGSRHLDAGVHRIRVSKPGGGWEPGNASGEEVPVGPIILVRPRPLPVRTAPVRDAFDVCTRGHLDWMELVRAAR